MPSKRVLAALETRPARLDEDGGPEQMNLRSLAIHEAGHAVADIHLDIPFTWVAALPKHGGWVDSSNPCVGWRRGYGPKAKLAERWAVSCFAGWAAEAVLGKPTADSYVEFDSAIYWLEQFTSPRGRQYVGDETYDRQVERMKDQAVRLMRDSRLEIDRVAAALRKLGALTCVEVEDVMAGRPVPKK